MLRRFVALAALAATAAAVTPSYQACNNHVARRFQYCNASLSFEHRTKELISLLTLDEKISLIAPNSTLGSSCNMHITHIDRIGLPEYMWLVETNTAVASVCVKKGQCATNFIGPEGLGASFNRSLWWKKGDVISTEMRALNSANFKRATGPNDYIGITGFGPNINIARDPRFGRTSELPGEDPLLSGTYASAYVQGMQQEDRKGYLKMIAYLKHYDAYSTETNRGHDNYNISTFDFFDTYLPQYEMAFLEGKASGVMCSYDAENGKPSCANDFLLNEMMRKRWNQPDAVVMTDCGAVNNMLGAPAYAPDNQHAAAWTLNNGTDLEAGTTIWTEHMAEAVKQGLVPERNIDAALYRTTLQLMRAGRFDDPAEVSWTRIPLDVVDSDYHRRVNYEAATQSLVLLKNDGVLPLKPGGHVAVIGPQGVTQEGLLSDYHGDEICWAPNITTKLYDCMETIAESIATANVGGKTTSVKGVDVNSADASGIQAAVRAAQAADVVVLALGIDNSIEHEGLDRTNISLPGLQPRLATEILALKKPTVLVFTNGGSLALGSLDRSVNALLETFNPATQARAVGQTLFGAENRFGKLPYTIYPADYIHEEEMTNYDMSKAPGRTYRYYTGKPEFPFGFGLSYTSFTLACRRAGPTLDFACSVSNVGGMDGDEVIQVYHSAGKAIREKADHPVPLRQLVDFQRVSVAKGASATVNFHLDAHRALSLTTKDGERAVYSGDHLITFSRGHGTDVDFEVTV